MCELSGPVFWVTPRKLLCLENGHIKLGVFLKMVVRSSKVILVQLWVTDVLEKDTLAVIQFIKGQSYKSQIRQRVW